MSIRREPDFAPEFTIPVLVIGAGACGLSAALAAKETGADVLVLERDATPAGSTAMSYGGICAAGTAAQARAGIEDNPAALEQDILAITHNQTDPALAHTVAVNAAPALDWLTETLAFPLDVEIGWTGFGHRVPRLHMPPGRSGSSLMGMFLNAAENAGIDILTQAKVSELIVDDRDRILGVRAERPGGSEEIGCEQLILASCGYGGDSDLIRRYMPELANAKYYGHEGNQGDALKWGQALGAAVADLGAYQSLGSLTEPSSLVMPHILMIGGGVQINARGERFEDELDDISGQALTILEQPGGVCWIVYDEGLHDEARGRFDEYRDGESINAYHAAHNWQDLAASIGVPPDALRQTMESVEALKRDGGTDQFGRRFSPKDALKPPYYAVKVTGALFHTQGGLCIDDQARVVREDGTPFPNLYAGGGAARSVSGPKNWGYLPGMGLCTAVALGRLAGIRAAVAASVPEPA